MRSCYELKKKEHIQMNEFQQNIISLYGDKGKQWINELPNIIKEYQKKWDLGQIKTVHNLTYNYVGLTHDKVFKIGFDTSEIQKEIKALQHFNMIKIFDFDQHAILMERCFPGTTLESLVPDQDEIATNIAIEVMKRMYPDMSLRGAHR